MTPSEELSELAKKLADACQPARTPEVVRTLEAVEEASRTVAQSFSGSWLGYHSRVYYKDFKTPPSGAHFSEEWGLKDLPASGIGSRGEWKEQDFASVRERVLALAGDPDLGTLRDLANSVREEFELLRSEVVSILRVELQSDADEFLASRLKDVEQFPSMTRSDVTNVLAPSGLPFSRDMVAHGQGNQVPPHIAPIIDVQAIRLLTELCSKVAAICRQVASHLDRRTRKAPAKARGSKVFIGHGRSPAWRDLKDLIQDQLGLRCDEFNQVPTAGVTIAERLGVMLDEAAIALLVMTAEDELADGEKQARMNVVHEAGLFQGRLGFKKAIILLEEGCAEFSNIHGLGQIRFPKGRISASFEEVRRVLEREGLIPVIGSATGSAG